MTQRALAPDLAFADALPQPLWAARPDGTVDYANPCWRAYTGFSPEASLGGGWADAVHPDDVGAIEERFRAAAVAGEPYEVEYRFRRADGAYRWHVARVAPIRDPGGAVVGWVGMATDVDERRRAEAALRASEERYRTLFASIDEGFCVVEVLFDADGRPVDYRFLEANPAFERHTGLRGAVGRTARELVPGLEEHWFATYGRVAATGEPLRFVDEARPMGGRSFDVYAFRLGAPERRQVAILFTDVTERRRAEADQARLAAIVESSWDAIVGRNMDGTITAWNPGAEALYGYAAEEIVGQSVARLLPPGTEDELVDITARLERGERVPPFETVRRCKDGTPVEVEMTVSPIADPDGRVVGVAAIARDVRERRAAERGQQEFLAAVSHDLKNPLGVARGQAQLLARRIRRGAVPDAEGLARALATIEAATGRMADQLDELQDAAWLRSGRPLELRAAPLDLVALAEEATADAQATTARHRLRVEAGGAVVVGRWDRLRLRRVLDNLLGNAVKYSPAGGCVAVSVGRAERDDGTWAVLTVRDQGVGIPAADLPHVFEHYRRGSNVGTRTRGTGIGLAGARRIVEQHGGRITVESEEGRGSAFTVELPLEPRTEPRR